MLITVTPIPIKLTASSKFKPKYLSSYFPYSYHLQIQEVLRTSHSGKRRTATRFGNTLRLYYSIFRQNSIGANKGQMSGECSSWTYNRHLSFFGIMSPLELLTRISRVAREILVQQQKQQKTKTKDINNNLTKIVGDALPYVWCVLMVYFILKNIFQYCTIEITAIWAQSWRTNLWKKRSWHF